MGVPEEEPEGEFAALAAVPSLSVSPRFVLPCPRDEGKRLLAALPPPAAAEPRRRIARRSRATVGRRPRPDRACRRPLVDGRQRRRLPVAGRASRASRRAGAEAARRAAAADHGAGDHPGRCRRPSRAARPAGRSWPSSSTISARRPALSRRAIRAAACR